MEMKLKRRVSLRIDFVYYLLQLVETQDSSSNLIQTSLRGNSVNQSRCCCLRCSWSLGKTLFGKTLNASYRLLELVHVSEWR